MIDCHCHSTASDGSKTPSELARLVKEAGLTGFALTDHDTALGVEEARKASGLHELVFIPGVELTGYHLKREWHVQALGIDCSAQTAGELMAPFIRRRTDRMRQMLSGLRSAGLNVDFGEILQEAGGVVVGRMHLASVMVRKGIVKRHRDAYRRYIGDQAPYYVPKLDFSVREAVELAYQMGGAPVLAHPGIPGLDEHIPLFKKWGLAGIEALTPKHTVARERKYLKMADELDLVVTAGTDFHGKSYETGPGARSAPLEVLERLMERSKAHSGSS